MPFGDGIRACVGKRFAWEEALIALIRIYQRYASSLALHRPCMLQGIRFLCSLHHPDVPRSVT